MYLITMFKKCHLSASNTVLMDRFSHHHWWPLPAPLLNCSHSHSCLCCFNAFQQLLHTCIYNFTYYCITSYFLLVFSICCYFCDKSNCLFPLQFYIATVYTCVLWNKVNQCQTNPNYSNCFYSITFCNLCRALKNAVLNWSTTLY